MADQDTITVLVLSQVHDDLLTESAEALRAAGFRVVAATSDRDLLHQVLETQHQLVLLDTAAAEMDVVTLVRQILRIQGGDGAIVTTAAPRPWLETSQLFALGAPEVLVRPFAPHDVVAAACKLVQRVRSRQSALPGDYHTYRAHLARLLQIMTDTLAADTYPDALKALATNLRQVFRNRAVGILHTAGTESIVYVSTPEHAVQTPLGRRLANALLHRYESLTGQQVSRATLQERIEADAASPDPGDSDTHNPGHETDLLLPFLGDGEVRGVLGLSSLTESDYSEGNLPFIFLLAGRIHPVLMALNQLKRLAFRDGLTGLHNRAHLEDAVSKALQQNRRYGQEFSVVLLDLDHLKQVYDRLGHRAGDLLLQDFARLLVSVSRGSDTVGRLGGDEFLVLLAGTSATGLNAFMGRLFAAIAAYRLTWAGRSYAVSASAGAVVIEGRAAAGLTAADVIAHSDAAMYDAKHGGKAGWTVWSAEVTAAADSPPASPPPAPAPARQPQQRGAR